MSFLVWIGIEPREVNWLASYIERDISNEDFSLKIDKTFVALSGFDELINIKVNGISAEYKGSKIQFPEASVKLSLLKLLNKEIAVSQLTVKNPKIALYVNDGKISFHEKSDIALNEIIENTLDVVENVVIKGADFSLYDNDKLVLKSSRADINLEKVGNFIAGKVDINLRENSHIFGKVALHTKTKQLTAYGQIKNLKLNVLEAFSDYNLDIPLTGGFNVRVSFEENKQSTAFKLHGNSGKVTIPEYFIEPLDIQKVEIIGSISNSAVKISDAKIQLPEGNITADVNYDDGKYSVDMELTDYKMHDLYKHWPISLGKETRKWVTEHIKTGDVEKATLSLSNLENEKKLDAEIHFENAILDYYSPLPPVKNAKGIAKFDNKSMNIAVSQGEMLTQTKGTTASVIIADFEKPIVDVRVNIDSTFKDLWEYFSYKPFEYNKKLAMNVIGGNAKGTLHLSIPVDEKVEIDFQANAKFTDADLDIGELKITNAKGDFTANNEKLSINADISDTKINIYGLKKQRGESGTINFDLIPNSEQKYIKNLDVRWKNTSVKGDISLKNNTIKSAKLSHIKFGKNDFKLNFDGDNLNITGNSLDILPFLDAVNFISEKQNKTVFHIKAKLKKLFVLGEEGLKNIVAEMFCKGKECEFVDIKGNTKKEFAISKTDGEISVISDDAGSFIKEFGVSEYINGGKMEIKATDISGTIKGEMIIWDFTVMNATCLTKILRLASFTGIVNTIRGKELSFEKAYIPFLYKNQKVIIERGAVAEGASVGFTGEGFVNIGGDLFIKGTIIPSYTFNTILGRIPFIGQALSGGNEGVFVTNYEVKKTDGEVDVYVNPFSTLAPNSLKELFR